MAKSGKKSFYEKFQEDYTAVIEPADNKDGFRIRYIYYAPWFLWDLPEKELKRKKRKISAECVCSIFIFGITAFLPTRLNALRLVAYPAIAALCGLLIEAVGVGQFFFAKYRTTRSTYESADRRIRIFSMLHLISCTLAFAGCVYYIRFWHWGLYDIAAALGYAVEAMLSCVICRQYREISFTTEKNDILNHVERATLDYK